MSSLPLQDQSANILNQQQSSSSAPIEPLHHPNQKAKVEVPHNVPQFGQGVSAMGGNGNAFLAKKMAAAGKSFYSPTDTLVSPCTAKLHLAKKKHYAKGKPVSLNSAFVSSGLAHSGMTSPASPAPSNASSGFLHPESAAYVTSQGEEMMSMGEDDGFGLDGFNEGGHQQQQQQQASSSLASNGAEDHEMEM